MQGNAPISPAPDAVSGSQGPEWLTQFVLDPPWWVNRSLTALAVFVAIVVAYRLYQMGFRVPFDTQIEIQRVVLHILGVMIAALALMTYTELPYWGDATGAAVLGIAGALGSQHLATRFPQLLLPIDPRERIMLAWTVLAITAFVIPSLVGLEQHGYLVVNTRWYLVGLSVAMALYDGFVIHQDQQELNL